MNLETAVVAERGTVGGPGGRTAGDPLSGFCEQAFGSLSRSDQRRWGELYVRGLVTIPGRKTIRKISELAGGTAADQSLQQFVNQSPWDWGPVRSELAHLVAGSAPVEAWIAAEVAFPKNGDSSVGVCTQYVGPAARTLNCQLAVALSFAGPAFCCPVNWRLMLPRSWDRDFRRRSRSHLPATERHRPGWQHVLDLLDEAVDGWGAAPRPVLADRRHDPDVEQLVGGLDERGLRYLVRIGDDLPIPVAGTQVRAADAQRGLSGERIAQPAAGGHRARRTTSPRRCPVRRGVRRGVPDPVRRAVRSRPRAAGWSAAASAGPRPGSGSPTWATTWPR